MTNFFRCIFPGCRRVDGWREERFVRKHIRCHHLAVDDRTCRLLTCGIKFKSKEEREEHEELHHPQFIEKVSSLNFFPTNVLTFFLLQVKSGQIRPSHKNQTGWSTSEEKHTNPAALRQKKMGQGRELSGPGFKKPVPLSESARDIKLPEFEGTEQEKYEQLQTWLRQFVVTKQKPPEYSNIGNFFKIIPFNVSTIRIN